MSNDALLVVQTLFSVIWRIFTSWYIPGTNVTPAVMALFLASAGIGLRLLVRFLDANYAAASEPVDLASGVSRRKERLNSKEYKATMNSIRERNAADRRARSYDAYHGIHHRDMP